MEGITLEKGIQRLIESNKIILPSLKKPLIEAIGEVIAEDVLALHHQPPFDRSPLDGYAVIGEDTSHATKEVPVELAVIDEVCAGHVSDKRLKQGQAIRIMTGAPMPSGSNGVIKQEDTDEGMNTVKIYKGINSGQNYCYAGEDYKSGDLLLKAGERLTAYHIGLLASNGITEVSIKRKLRVGLMSTGDELLEPGTPLEAGKIYNSNLYTLRARLIELGCEPVVIGRIHDDVKRGVTLIEDIINHVDIVVTTGGVSVGKMDIMHPLFKSLGADRLFWRLQLKPGTPALAGLYQNKLILALSGNPSAASITFELLFRPLLSHITACEDLNIKTIEAKMAVDFLKTSPTRRFIKAYVEGNQVYMTRGNQSSGALKSMIGCNCLIDVKAGSDRLKIGDSVKLVLI